MLLLFNEWSPLIFNSILGVVEDSILGKDVIKKEDKNEYEPPLKKKEKVYEIKQEKKIYKTVENKNSEPLILEEQKPLILEDSPNFILILAILVK